MAEQFKCSMCGAPATIHVTRLVDGKMVNMHLCEKCAAKFDVEKIPIIKFAEMLAKKILGDEAVKGIFKKSKAKENQGKTCPCCGMPDRVRKMTDMMGCPECYEFFAEEIEEVFPKIQHAKLNASAEKPADKSEKNSPEPKIVPSEEENMTEDQLRELIKNSVARDDYETAAHARDILRKKTSEAAAKKRANKKGETNER